LPYPTKWTSGMLISGSDWNDLRLYGAADYIVFSESGNYYAYGKFSGSTDYSGVDASAVIQAAGNALTGSGGLIHIKTGSYILPTKLSFYANNLKIEGEGDATTLVPPTNDYAIEMGGYDKERSYCKILNLCIQPSTAGAGKGIHFIRTAYSQIDKVSFTNCSGSLKMNYSYKPLITDCQFRGFRGIGIELATSGSDTIGDQTINNCYLTNLVAGHNATAIQSNENVNGVFITNCLITGHGVEKGVYISGSWSGGWMNNVVVDSITGSGFVFHHSNGHGTLFYQLVNCWAQSCLNTGIIISGSSAYPNETIIIDNSIFDSNRLQNVYVYHGKTISFNNCRIGDCSDSILGADVEFDQTEDSSITNSYVTATNSRGIRIDNSTGSIISNNRIQSPNDYGIHIISGSYCNISGNKLKSIYGITLYNNGVGCTIHGNTILSSGSKGISIGTGSSHNIVSDNFISGSSDKAIDIADASCVKNMVIGNRIIEASGTTAIYDGGTNTTVANNSSGSS